MRNDWKHHQSNRDKRLKIIGGLVSPSLSFSLSSKKKINVVVVVVVVVVKKNKIGLWRHPTTTSLRVLYSFKAPGSDKELYPEQLLPNASNCSIAS